MNRMKHIFALLMIAVFLMAAAGAEGITRRRLSLRGLAERAASGDARALYQLSRLHDSGYDSIAVDSARAAALCLESARLGYVPAQSDAGFRYFRGEGVRRDVDSALYWTRRAAEAGDARAANNMGYLSLRGEYVAQDTGKAFEWFTVAADAGLPVGQSQLADMYREGLGTPPDTLKAAELYSKALESGLRDAGLKLLSMMERRWKDLPADSIMRLGRRYYTRNAPEIGIALLRDAAAHGNADALAILGDAYSRANGVDYDHDRSVACFLEAALRGQPSAQFFVAEMLDVFPDALRGETESGVIRSFYGDSPIPADIHTAAYWYALASARGVSDARSATRHLFPGDQGRR